MPFGIAESQPVTGAMKNDQYLSIISLADFNTLKD